LVLNGGAPLAINANGAFVLGNGLTSGSSYTVTVGTQPAGQTCAVTGNSGTVAAGGFVGVGVSCEDILFAYVANYAGNNVSAYRINPLTGAFTEVAGGPIAAGNQPVAVAVDPSSKFVYVANAATRSARGNVSAYTINRTTGALTAVAGSPFAAGTQPAAVAVDPSSKFVYVANVFSNNVSAYSINQATGALTPVAGSPFATDWYPVSVAVDPSGRFAYVVGNLNSNVSVYSINPTTGAFTAVVGSIATGGQPASIAVHPSGKFAYVANGLSNDVSAYIIDPTTGILAAVAGSPFAAGNIPTSVKSDPSGNFVYVTNAIGGSGSAYWNGSVSAYSINQTTGALTAVVGSPFLTAGTQPNDVAFDPTGQFAYTANSNQSNISAYRINSATGALTALAGSPFAVGNGPVAIVTVRPR
jgi:6-phosphogluconolactonase